MEKTATLNLRINPSLKQDAENILSKLGIPMSTAVNMFLNQVVLTEGIPFPVKLTNTLDNIDITKMDSEQLHDNIKQGYDDYKAGRVQDAESAFASFRNNHYQ